MFALVERLDGLPRHIALHPCGVLLSDRTLLDRTPVEASWLGFPMSQFDKDDVEDLGLLKLDVLGIRMQSAMAHAVQRGARGSTASRSTSTPIPLRRPGDVRADPVDAHPRLLPDRVARSARAGRQVRAGDLRRPHHRHLAVPARPGQVRHGDARSCGPGRAGRPPQYLHPDLEPALAETYGVVVFHEQVLEIVARHDRLHARRGRRGAPLARLAGHPARGARVVLPARPRARATALELVEQVWEVLRAFASFGFCKAHAAAFALPTYQSAWLKAHHPAAFLAGVLTHDPGMYPKRLILDDARQLGIAVLPLDVNASDDAVPRRAGRPLRRAAAGHPRRAATAGARAGQRAARRSGVRHPARAGRRQGHQRGRGRPDRGRPAVRHAVRLLAPRPGGPAGGRAAGGGRGVRLAVRHRLAGPGPPARPGDPARPAAPGGRPRPLGPARPGAGHAAVTAAQARADRRRARPPVEPGAGVVAAAARQSQAPAAVRPPDVQLALDLGPEDGGATASGLPEMSGAERVRAELESSASTPAGTSSTSTHPVLDALGVTRVPRPAAPAQPGRGAGGRGQGRDPDPADPLRPAGRVPDPRRLHRPGRRHLLRGRPGPVRRDGLPLLAAGGPRRRAADRAARHQRARHRGVGAVRRCSRRGSPAARTPSVRC